MPAASGPTGVLVRVGADQSYGRANSPIRISTGEFVYVPIPERADRVREKYGRSYSELAPRVRAFVGVDAVEPWLPSDQYMHLDPDFECLSYGDVAIRRGARIASLSKGDFLAFYASLRAIDRHDSLAYALIGILTVERIVRATDIPEADYPLNAHTRRKVISADDVVVFGMPGVSGRMARAIPIGEYRDRAYRVRRDLLDAWGGLNVSDGYIQRSAVPPLFLEPAKFLDWLRRQSPTLVREN